jgi:hypothetical protein
VALDRRYTERLIEALEDNSDPVSCDAAEEFRRLLTSPPKRQPLPAHEIVTMYDECPTGDSDMIAFAREIEAAHGIGENT